jgi:NhaP-type Na+/H+ or K+/H+ antiporter
LLGVLSIWEAAVLGALLAPTDAALGQPVVSNPDVPGPVRRSLIVEAGLNDGLAVPFAFAFAAAGEIFAAETTVADGLLFLVQQVGIGVVVGAAVGWLGGKGLLIASQRGLATSTAIEIAFLALAGVSFAAAEWLHGNGFISAWVAGLLFAVATEHQLEARAFAMRAGDLLTLLSFFLFGVAVLPVTLDRIEGAWILYALASLVLIRPIAVSLSMLGSRLRFPTIAYLGWFGPRGIASLILVLLVEKQFDLAGIETVIDVVTVTVALSVVLHGATAWRGSEMYAEWIQRHGLGPLKRYERPESSGNA